MEVLILLLAHLIGDFYFQTDKMVKNKRKFLKRHLIHQFLLGFIALFFIYLFLEGTSFWYHVILPVILLTCAHWLIDIGKIKAEAQLEGKFGKLNSWKGALFVIDQLFHLLSIVLISLWFFQVDMTSGGNTILVVFRLVEGSQPSFNVLEKVLLLLIMIMITTTVSGHFIRNLLGSLTNHIALFEGKYSIKDTRNGQGYIPSDQKTSISEEITYTVMKNQDLSRGKVIGYLERLLVIILILNDSIGSIAFIIAAKSITRFKQLDDRDWAEYFLLGTLTSIFLAIVYGFLIKFILFN
ncbi:DUF3307 domain-containing protein [Evansella tamaricis]|uniref:DUF3307 domain-containing protein n=1 Tax=Evansella tamaricis TaxID=2069301 RepID=A0ABS6JEC7_9BACI|nr:DUF3307 domain-containing protein [Evansella tamaricis]MBU9712030.1 DUF3307 domain-containing protein [Evansella tamaricis]